MNIVTECFKKEKIDIYWKNMRPTLNSANIVFYSPTGTSRKIARAIGDGLRLSQLSEFDITFSPKNLVIDNTNTLTVFVVPVYGGRVAITALERMHSIKGNNSLAAVVVVYGNRHYDDALIELRDEVEKMGFIPVAGAAFVGEHSFSTKEMPVAAGRPDMYDISMSEHFGKEVVDKINSVVSFGKLHVPGNYPYRERSPKQNVAPVSTDDCNACGVCVDYCPTGAIELNDRGEITTDTSKCTLCCACVKSCPHNARVFETPFTKILFENFRERKNPEFFF